MGLPASTRVVTANQKMRGAQAVSSPVPFLGPKNAKGPCYVSHDPSCFLLHKDSNSFRNLRRSALSAVLIKPSYSGQSAPSIMVPLSKHSGMSSLLSSNLFQGKFFKSKFKCWRVGGEAEILDCAMGGAWVALKKWIRIY